MTSDKAAVKPVAWIEYAENGNVRMWNGDLSAWNSPDMERVKPLYSAAAIEQLNSDHAAALQAAIETAQRQAEIDSLDQWLRMAREPIGQECCGMGRFECCGDAVPVYATPNEVFKAMSKRHAELVAALAPAKKVD